VRNAVSVKPTNSHKGENQATRPARRLGRFFYIVLGLFAFTLGAVGIVMPFLPTTPFVLLAAFCFGKSSSRLHGWFISTQLYRKNLESFVQQRGMTWKTKLALLASVTFFMGLSFLVMIALSAPFIARIVLAVVWLCHMLYFGFLVKTIC